MSTLQKDRCLRAAHRAIQAAKARERYLLVKIAENNAMIERSRVLRARLETEPITDELSEAVYTLVRDFEGFEAEDEQANTDQAGPKGS